MLASLRCPGPLRLAVLLAVGLPATLAAEPIHLSGRVLIPAETVQGLGGARVELLPQVGDSPVATAKTDAAGFFELTAPESGCFRVRMRAAGYLDVEAPFLPVVEETDLTPAPALASSHAKQITPGSPAGGEWYFGAPAAAQPPPATPRLVQGKVSDPKGAPVAGALVWSEGSPAVPCVKSGADGVFQIRAPASGEVRLRAVAPGYFATEPRAPSPPEFQGAPFALRLAYAGSISGRVLDEAGSPVSRARVEALPTDEPSREGAVWSRANGRFRLSALSPGRLYRLAVTQDGFAPASVMADALSRDRPPKLVRIVLERGATVLGKVMGPEGKPVPSAELTLMLSQQAMLSQGLPWNSSLLGKTVSDATGAFALSHLSPGRFQLRVERKGFVVLSLPDVEVPSRTAKVDLGTLTLDRGLAIEGQVVDPGGVPLPDVGVNLVSVRGSSSGFDSAFFTATRTDSEGRFRFEDLRPGARFDVNIEHPGYVPAAVRSVEAPTLEPLRIELKMGRILAGRVKGPAGEPVPKAEISIHRVTTIRRAEGTYHEESTRQLGATDEEGRFRLAGIEPGTMELVVHAQGYQAARLQGLAVPEESDVEGLEIVLLKGSVLEIRALDSRRQPVSGAWITAYLAGPASGGAPGFAQCRTDDEGRCRLESLDQGRYDVSARSEEHGHAEASVEVAPGVNQRDLTFLAGARVSGKVSDEAGMPVPGAGLSLSPLESGAAFSATSLADGTFQFPAVSDGTYRLSGSAPDFAETAAPGDVQVAGQEVGGLVLRLSRGATVTGKVLGLEPEEMESVSIQAFRTDLRFSHPQFARADSEGRYKLSNLPPGDWRINAQTKGRSIQETLQIAPGVRETVLDLVFPAGYTLTGRVTMDGAPFAGAQVVASSNRGSFQALTGPDGGFRIPNVPSGRYTLTAMDPEGLGTSANVEVAEDQEVNLDFSTGGLRVTALAGGAPVANALIHLSGSIPFFGRGGWTTDAAGSFEAPRVASGTYTVFVQKEGLEPTSASVEIRPGAMAEVLVNLKPSQ
ncbi:MAG TPA: carboxypeptidase-like regulatory domain-containing protein [Thermoanaerobaculia bacterium]|jgi:protocatechuate 3,4-dioxygenase beta subunit